MASEKVETVIAGNYVEMEREEQSNSSSAKSKLSKFFWHGGSIYDAWFSCASNQAFFIFIHQWLMCPPFFISFNSPPLCLHEILCCAVLELCVQVAQVLLTLPYSFSQLGMVSGIIFQLFYGLMGSWTAYLICVLYIEYRTRKEREKVDFRNHVIQVLSFSVILENLVDPAIQGQSDIHLPTFCSHFLQPLTSHIQKDEKYPIHSIKNKK